MNGDTGAAVRWDGDKLILQVRVQPRARRNEIVGVSHSRLRVRTTAAPTDGKANKAVRQLLSDYLGVPVSRIELTHGITHRDKRLVVGAPVTVPDGLPVAGRAPNSL